MGGRFVLFALAVTTAGSSAAAVVPTCNGRVVFRSGRGAALSTPSVYTVATRGGAPRKLIANAYHAIVSPDGRRIAFLRDGAIWAGRLHAPHGYHLLVAHPGYAPTLTWSPHSDAIAYTVGYLRSDLWVVWLDARRRFLVEAGNSNCCSFRPSWSPDGRHILISRGSYTRPTELVVASPQTGRVSPVEGSDGIRFGAWSPDGRRIAGTSSAGTVVILDRAGRQRILARETELDSWSPDGRWLLVRRGQRELGLVHPSGGRVHWLASSELTDSLGGLIWDPTGTTIYGMRYRTVIALPLNGPARLVPVAPPAPTLLDPPDAVVSLLPGNTRLTLTLRPVDGSLYSVGADGLRVRAFGPLLGEWPAWSPDGSRVAYTSGFTNGDLFVADADGQNARDLGVRGSRPAWSPDGSMIAFDRNLDTTGGWGGFVSIGTEFSPTAVEVLTLSDGAVRTLGAGQHPTWSPDGTEMAAARSGEIVAFSLATSAVRTLTNLRGKSHSCAGYRAQQPAWGPDGRSIAYTEWFSGCGESTSSIALLDLASGRTAALTVADKFAGDEDPAWEPDGSEVAYASHMSSPEQALAAVGVRRPGSRSLYAGPGGGAEPAWQPAACPTASG